MGNTKTIDKKYRAVKGKLIDSSTGEAIPPDVPVFVLRADEPYAVRALNHLRETARNRSPEYCAYVKQRLEKFNAFRNKYPGRLQHPDPEWDSEHV